MRSVLLLLGLWTWANIVTAQAAPASAGPSVQLVLELSDGSRIVGTPEIEQLKMATDYANFEMPLSLLRTVEFSGSNHVAQLNLQNGDQLSVRLAATEIAVKTVFGQAMIPIAQTSKIRVTSIDRSATAKAMPEGLVLHYTFDKDEGDLVTDKSDAGNNGKVVGGTYTNEGKIGGAMGFNGDRQEVLIGNPASLQLQNFTIMAWIKRSSTTEVSQHFFCGNVFGYGQMGYTFGIGRDCRLFLSKVQVDGPASALAVQDENFHHIAVTKQGDQVVFYLDGVAEPAITYNTNFEFDTDAAVGCRPDNLTGSFLGVIDEVAVFNRALSADEVKGIYDSQK